MKTLYLFVALCCLGMLAPAYHAAQDDSNPPCWGSDKPCEDGKYRDYQGKEQPASCDNFSKTGKAAIHDCECEAATQCAHPGKPVARTGKCKTYCRPKACSCIKDCS
jgi:hypothetical protein